MLLNTNIFALVSMEPSTVTIDSITENTNLVSMDEYFGLLAPTVVLALSVIALLVFSLLLLADVLKRRSSVITTPEGLKLQTRPVSNLIILVLLTSVLLVASVLQFNNLKDSLGFKDTEFDNPVAKLNEAFGVEILLPAPSDITLKNPPEAHPLPYTPNRNEYAQVIVGAETLDCSISTDDTSYEIACFDGEGYNNIIAPVVKE